MRAESGGKQAVLVVFREDLFGQFPPSAGGVWFSLVEAISWPPVLLPPLCLYTPPPPLRPRSRRNSHCFRTVLVDPDPYTGLCPLKVSAFSRFYYEIRSLEPVKLEPWRVVLVLELKCWG
ncbi:hypothetical protein OPV22_029402 [Ensete ventricosum]|uniref:Uncharacterized protein n=1 Tax=Ensete ventricosum TaxID=4639 RepID=A0AAV8QD73_ENSVE|nr:hypothetical protein OPV22_029402 [Ensete ventricosum]